MSATRRPRDGNTARTRCERDANSECVNVSQVVPDHLPIGVRLPSARCCGCDSAEALGRLALTKLPPPQQPQTAETAAPAPAAPTGCFRARAETTPRRAGAYNISTCFAGAKRFGRTDPSIW
eukprot:1177631-Prorocentrum_minimum.AAC.2